MGTLRKHHDQTEYHVEITEVLDHLGIPYDKNSSVICKGSAQNSMRYGGKQDALRGVLAISVRDEASRDLMISIASKPGTETP